jgi:hypothetical protein
VNSAAFAKITVPDMTLRRVPTPVPSLEPTPVTAAVRTRPKTVAIPELVDSIIQMALARRASDIHFEPNEQGIAVRFRVDGLLQNVEQIALEMRAAVISRIKIMGNMDISEHRLPQDGRIKIRQKHQSVDIRISTMPSLYGENVVMRLLDLDNAALPLSGTGVGPEHLNAAASPAPAEPESVAASPRQRGRGGAPCTLSGRLLPSPLSSSVSPRSRPR